MSATVTIPNHLARHFNTSQMHVEASDLKRALEIVSRDYDLDDVLLTPNGDLQSYIRIVIDEEVIPCRKSSDLSGVTVSGKIIHILTGFAGG